MPSFFRRPLLVLLMAAALAACESQVTRPQFPEFTYGHLPPIGLDVARVEFVDRYRPPLAAPNVEHLFPTPPAAAVERWVADRLRAVGVRRVLRVYLEDAGAVSRPLPSQGGIEAMFTTEQTEEVAGHIAARAEVVDDDGLVLGYATVEVNRSRTLPEDLTLNERDQIYFELTEAMMNDFNGAFENNIRTYLKDYVR